VAVDLRQGSDTLYRWVAAELSAENGCSLYVPAGFAHGFQTVEDESEVFYQMTEMYHPGLARGARWDDPLLAIDWPVNDPIMSDRDRTFDLLAGESA
jgi:dTDP-4-dehydrorhamnose 3,5-epimerase